MSAKLDLNQTPDNGVLEFSRFRFDMLHYPQGFGSGTLEDRGQP